MSERAFKYLGAEFSLTWDENHPNFMYIYFWELPEGSAGYEVLQKAIEEATGRSVSDLSMQAGNGHGSIEVTYAA